MQDLTVVKIGGNVIDHEGDLSAFLSDFSKIEGRKILVHGGGKVATDIAKSLGIHTEMIDGRRITSADSLKVVTMVYGGLINKRIVCQLQAAGCNAIGLTGADGNIIEAHKRKIKDIDYGFVGDIDTVNTRPLRDLLESNFSIVFAPLTHDQQGTLLNTNADTIAATLASALAAHYATRLITCFEKNGVLAEMSNDDSVIPAISLQDYADLKARGIIIKGMLPKLDTAFSALKDGVGSVIICNARRLKFAVNPERQEGTQLYI